MARLVIRYQDEEVLEVKAGDDIELSFQEGLCELVDAMDSDGFSEFLWSHVEEFIRRHEAPDGINYGDNAQRFMKASLRDISIPDPPAAPEETATQTDEAATDSPTDPS